MTNKALIAGCLFLAAACSTTSGRLEMLKTRAAFDLNCPKEQLQTTDLGGAKTYGVVGCGKRATYVGNHCYGSVAKSHCQWIMNTDEEAASGGEGAAPSEPAAQSSTATTGGT